MTDQQAGTVLSAPQDQDDPALVRAAAQTLGRKGGRASRAKLTAEQRQAAARHAAEVRWQKRAAT